MASNARTPLKVVGQDRSETRSEKKIDTDLGEKTESQVEAEASPVSRSEARKARPAARKKSAAKKASPKNPSSSDPVRVYLRDMGQVSLLTREGEVAIAKRIEAGIIDQEVAVLGSNSGLCAVADLGQKVRNREIEIVDVVDMLEGDDAPSASQVRTQFLKAIDHLKKVEPEIQRRRKCRARVLCRSEKTGRSTGCGGS